jgi:hypothetical protein
LERSQKTLTVSVSSLFYKLYKPGLAVGAGGFSRTTPAREVPSRLKTKKERNQKLIEVW